MSKKMTILSLDQDRIVQEKTARLYADGTVKPRFSKRGYVYERRALVWVKTVFHQLHLTKGLKPAIFVFEECALPIVFKPHEFPATNPPNGHCVSCKIKPYEYADSHLLHEFKENKVERNLVQANSEMNKTDPMQIFMVIGIGFIALILAFVAWKMGIFDPSFWQTPRKN